jgi:ribonuclease HII
MAGIDSHSQPDYELERTERLLLAGHIAGVDEAGRGPLAGPVVAAAVILNPDDIPSGIDDSKRLTPEKREELFAAIARSALAFGIAIADVALIDRINILQATMWAMAKAVRELTVRPRLVLVDGNRLPKLRVEARAVIGGDRLCVSIAAASIMAKVTRDRLMADLASHYPGYGFERHKGYATRSHRDAIFRLGPTPHHRKSFRPVQLAMAGLADTSVGADGEDEAALEA